MGGSSIMASSGPLGTELPGRWLTSDEMLSVWRQLVAYDLRMGELASGSTSMPRTKVLSPELQLSCSGE